MDIIKRDFKKGMVMVRVTDAEDLWYLSHLIDSGDLLSGVTTRKIKIGSGENAKVVKKTMRLTIATESLELVESVLRVNGKIKEGPEDVPRDSYHALEIELGTECTIQKEKWLEFQKKKLEEAAEQKRNYLICVFDREEAWFAVTKKQGYGILLQLKGEAEKKRTKVEIKQDFYVEIIKVLHEYAQRYQPESVVVASPAFYKDDLYKKMPAELKRKVVLAICSDVSERAFEEVMRRPELNEVLKGSRAREDSLLMEELLREINKNNLAVYGWTETGKTIDAGAVRILLLTDNCIKQARKERNYELLDSWMQQVESQPGKIRILSSEQDAGRILDGLGGIAALLRYSLEW
ncbi:mRNA surveillance protein pelota [Candidatus Woesearchaeota archaeon]|nr:mRNA surveillance protein pelota [Candidatus Woesearchaeota archaeon]